MLQSLYASIIGFVLDLLFGDPQWMFFHPIRLIGKLIAVLEKGIRKTFPKSKTGELVGGMVLVLIVSMTAFIVPFAILCLCNQIHPMVTLAAESIFCYFLFATKSLKTESMKVYHALQEEGLLNGRKAVSMIVGRDVDSLNEEGVCKACVETVAENTSDGIIAPMFFMILGGAPLGYFYKAINTMDSMIGYKNDKYLYFGRYAAKADDIINFIPARLSALFMLVASTLVPSFHGKGAWNIYRRDRKRSESPNAAQTESVCAGALRVRLLGDAYYFGVLHKKASIGDEIEQVTPKKIIEVNKLLYATAVIGMLFLCCVKFLLILKFLL
ncbi:MAG: cobalamin biosynthesis protein CobD [Clostridium sp.]|nr:cobalamin biosynthesis protein CobD [Clostridium sp.]